MKIVLKNFFITSLFVSLFLSSNAQNTTIDNDKKTEAMLNAHALLKKEKVLIIPFEPKMYMSEIDKKVNAETKQSSKQIYSAFREGLDDMIYLAVKQKTNVYSFLNDSAKCAKDMALTYAGITYSYDLIPPDNASRNDLNKTKQTNVEPKIVNGQIVVAPNMDKKFMNTKITNPKLLEHLSQKYGASVFIFINQLDIKNNPQSYDVTNDTYKREVTVHYTIMNKEGKYLAYGIATSVFSSLVNDPQKITKTSFSAIANTIADKLVAAHLPETGVKYVDKPKNKPKFN